MLVGNNFAILLQFVGVFSVPESENRKYFSILVFTEPSYWAYHYMDGHGDNEDKGRRCMITAPWN